MKRAVERWKDGKDRQDESPVDNPLSRNILLIRFHVFHDWCGAVGPAVFCCCWRVWWTTTMARHLTGRTAGCQRDGDVHGRVEE